MYKGATRPRVAIAVPKERDQKVKRSTQFKQRPTPSRVDIRPKGFVPSIWVLLWCPKFLGTYNHVGHKPHDNSFRLTCYNPCSFSKVTVAHCYSSTSLGLLVKPHD